jgi:hypothetical protein
MFAHDCSDCTQRYKYYNDILRILSNYITNLEHLCKLLESWYKKKQREQER